MFPFVGWCSIGAFHCPCRWFSWKTVKVCQAFALQLQKLQQSWDDAENRVQQLPGTRRWNCCETWWNCFLAFLWKGWKMLQDVESQPAWAVSMFKKNIVCQCLPVLVLVATCCYHGYHRCFTCEVSKVKSAPQLWGCRLGALPWFIYVSLCFFGSLLAEWLGKHPGFRGVSRSSSRRAKTNVGDLEFCVFHLSFLFVFVYCLSGRIG